MKRTNILFLALVIVTLSACKKSWLEVIPQGQKITETTEDYELLMRDYAFYFAGPGGAWDELVSLGDEVAVEAAYFNNYWVSYLNGFRWSDSIFTTTASPQSNMLSGYYDGHSKNTYVCNKIISEVMESTGGTEQQKMAIMAAAKATRAYSLFNIANVFCKPYNEATAATDPGFPIASEPNVEQTKFSRGTLKETYDFIIKDLTDALQTIPVKQDNVTRMSKPGVEGILGKVYLTMGRYQEALDLFNSSLSGAIANGQTALYDYNVVLAPGGAFTPIDPFIGPVNSPGVQFLDIQESVLYKAYQNIFTSNGGEVLEPKAQALFAPSDLRLLLYSDTNPDFSPNAGGRLRKITEQYSRWGLQIQELYLLIAECKARLNDLSGAVAAVETLRINRMPPADAPVPAAIAANRAELVKFIFDERIREFALSGMRWFDMRRIASDPIFAGIEFTHTQFNEDGSETIFTLEQPNRLTVRIPKNIMDANPGMENNP